MFESTIARPQAAERLFRLYLSLIAGLLAGVILAGALGQYPAVSVVTVEAEAAPSVEELLGAAMDDDLAPPMVLGAAAFVTLTLCSTQPRLLRLSRRWPPPLRPPQP